MMLPKTNDLLVIKRNGEEIRYTIKAINGSSIILEDDLLGRRQTRKLLDIAELIVSGDALFERMSTNSQEVNRSTAEDFVGANEQDRDKARWRNLYVSAYLESGVSVKTDRSLGPIIDRVYEGIKGEEKPGWDKKPSPRSVTRWINNYIGMDESIRALLPKDAKKGNRNAKLDSRAETYVEKAIKHYLKTEKCSVRSAYEHMKNLIDCDNFFLDKDDKIRVPSYAGLNGRIKKINPSVLDKARSPGAKTNKKYAQNKKGVIVSTILERVEVDHTQLDLFVIDNEMLIPLGRPYLTNLIDYYSKSVVGFHVGFEPPSYVSVACALRHALLPKGYIKERYPAIERDWPVFGQIQTLVTDRGKEFESNWLNDACLDLGITLQFNQAYKPWLKGTVESYFNTLNKRLLDDIPGKSFSDIFDREEYNSEKNAVILFDSFIEMLHRWVVDIYQVTPHGTDNIIPDMRWREKMEDVVLWPPDPKKLDIVMGEIFEKSNTQKGIKIDHIQYDSDRLAKLRAKRRDVKVRVKRNRENIGSIYVFDSNKGEYFVVEALDFEYANNLSVWQHQKIIEFARKRISEYIDNDSLARAKAGIREIIARDLASQKKVKNSYMSKLARFASVGQGGNTGGSIVDSLGLQGVKVPGEQESNAKAKQADGFSIQDVMNDMDDDVDDSGWDSSSEG